MSGDQKIDLVKPDVNKPWCRPCRGHMPYRVVITRGRTSDVKSTESITYKCEECGSSMLTQENMRESITRSRPLIIGIPIIVGILIFVFIPGKLPDDIKFALLSEYLEFGGHTKYSVSGINGPKKMGSLSLR